MSHQAVVAISLLAGAVAASIPGRMIGQIVFDRDEAGCPGMNAVMAMALSVITVAHSWTHFGALGLLSLALVFPIYWLCSRLAQFVVHAPELKETAAPWKSAERIKQENLSFHRALFAVIGLMSGAAFAGAGAQHFGIAGGLVAIMLNPISTVVATGAFVAFFMILAMVMSLFIRLCHKSDDLARIVSNALRCKRG